VVPTKTTTPTGEQGFLQEYAEAGMRETMYFFQSIFGTSYQKQNTCGFDQK
jgi:hypothetical protein